jgi:hypothetical protein
MPVLVHWMLEANREAITQARPIGQDHQGF